MVTPASLLKRGAEIRRLAESHRTENVRVFGSVARGENTGASDVDLLVTPRPGCSLFDLGGLLEDLQDLLNCKMDLVTKNGLKARLRDLVLQEAVPLSGKFGLVLKTFSRPSNQSRQKKLRAKKLSKRAN